MSILYADGMIAVPMRAEGPGGIIGDGAKFIGPGDEGYEKALRHARPASREQEFFRREMLNGEQAMKKE